MNGKFPLNKISIERLNNGQPILSAVDRHPWEGEVVFNPACVLLQDKSEINRLVGYLSLSVAERKKVEICDAICVLIYRAQGTLTVPEDYRRSRLGLALLTPGLELIYRHPEPIVVPENDYEDLGVEDPRITKIDGKYVMLYTGYSSHGKRERKIVGRKKINICMSLSDDLVNWEKKGVLKGRLNEIDNKNAVLFPIKIGGKYHLLHRPMEGTDPMTVHVAHADSLFDEWDDDGVLWGVIKDKRFSKSWVGAGAPPLILEDNKYLVLYHIGHYGLDRKKVYELGICTLGFDGKLKVHERIEPLLTPQTRAEIEGNKLLGVNNVVFVCGAYFCNNHLYFPYAGADSVMLGARVKIKP